MRELTRNEMALVAGAAEESSDDEEVEGSNIGGQTDRQCLCHDLIEVYTAAVRAVSRLIEQVMGTP